MSALRVWIAVSMLSAMGVAAAQAPSAKPATAKAATTAKPSAATPATPAEDGNPVPASPFPAGPPTKGGQQLDAIHKADTAWRETQRGYQAPGRQQRVQPAVLRAVDPVTQQKTLEHLEGVKAQLDKLPKADMSQAEQMNLEIYLYQVESQIDAQKFKEWEKPVNSLEQFWSGVQGTGQRGFRTEKDYENFLLYMADIPRSAYAVDEEVTGAMCLFKTDGGYEVFSCAEDARHEVRFFEDEEAAYFYLFGVLAAEAVRHGRLSPRRG